MSGCLRESDGLACRAASLVYTTHTHLDVDTQSYTHLTCWPMRAQTHTIKVSDCQGPHEPASGLNRLVQLCVCACVWAAIETLRSGDRRNVISWYYLSICRGSDWSKEKKDGIMSGEHPQCIWSTEKGAEFRLHFNQGTARCQNVSISCRDMGVRSICEKLRDDCTHLTVAPHLDTRCERTEQSVCTRPVSLQSKHSVNKSLSLWSAWIE